MEKILEETFVNYLNKSTITDIKEKKLVEDIIKCDKFTLDIKYLAIKKIFQPDQVQTKNAHTCNVNITALFDSSEHFVEEIFLKNLENMTTDTKNLIMMVISYEKFTIDSKLRILKELFTKIFDINFGNCPRTNPLMMLCTKSHINNSQRLHLIKFLVEEIKVDINKLSIYNTTAIMFAYQENQLSIVNYLLIKGAKIKYTLSDGSDISIINYCNCKISSNSINNCNCTGNNYKNLMSYLISFYSKKLEDIKST